VRFTFLGPDGSVCEAAAAAPWAKSGRAADLPASVPVVLSLHGTGVEPRAQCDSYQFETRPRRDKAEPGWAGKGNYRRRPDRLFPPPQTPQRAANCRVVSICRRCPPAGQLYGAESAAAASSSRYAAARGACIDGTAGSAWCTRDEVVAGGDRSMARVFWGA
jgi:hypothetical protein